MKEKLSINSGLALWYSAPRFNGQQAMMLAKHIDTIETIGFNLGLAILFFFIAMAIHDVLKKGDVPLFGRLTVWLVLFLGCAGFIAKGLIQILWTSSGLE